MSRLLIRIFSLTLLFFLILRPLVVNSQETAGIRAFSEAENRMLQAYVAVYSRPPDPPGLRYWSNRLRGSGGSLEAIIRPFGNSAEFRQRFGHLEYSELIRNIYIRLFNREPEPGGVAFYLRELESGAMDLSSIAMRIFDGARNSDRDAVANKTRAAAYFVSQVERDGADFPDDGEALAPLIRPAADTAPSFQEAVAVIDRLLESWGPGSELLSFSSDQALLDYLKTAIRRSAEFSGAYADRGFVDGSVPAVPGEGAGLDADFSRTTLQEEGVDEADSIKTDGSYLYIATQGNVLCCPGFLDDALTGESLPEEEPAAIRVLEMLDAPAATREIARIALNDLSSPVDGLYLLTDRDDDRGDLLVTVGGGTSYPIWTNWLRPWEWQDGSAEIALFDVDDPETPQLLTSIELEGQLIASRRIDEMLYVVTRFVPSPDGYRLYPEFGVEEESNEVVLEELTLDDLLPRYTVNRDGAVGSLVDAQNSFLPPTDVERLERPTLITVTAISLADPSSPPQSTTLVGPTETVYVAQQALYLATTRNDYLFAEGGTETDLAPSYPHRTDVHKFSLTASGPSYRGSGRVVGHLGWDPGKKPFRMGEHDGVLRVATSVGDDWNGTASTRLTLLREDTEATEFALRETAYLDNIGKEGERLFASRFIGDRAYLVTFRVTDPLYVFDLSDPTRIQQLAEIEIEGYSDYLYPLGGDLLLGIGKDAVPDTSAEDFAGRGAWYQGVKLALFDVSGSGAELASLVLGKRGTESAALYDHHAVTLLQPAASDTTRLALPMRLHDGDEPDPAPPWIHYPWQHTGLYLFEIGTGPGRESIANTGRIIVAENDGIGPGFYTVKSDRSVIVGDNVHYIHGDRVWSSTWSEDGELTGPQ